MKKLSMKALALSLGISYGMSLLFLGWAAALGWGGDIVFLMSSFYLGFSGSFIGGIFGAIWGFVLGAISGIVVAFLYNHFLKKAPKK